MRERWARLEKAGPLPDLPEPGEKYFRAIETVSEVGEPAKQATTSRPRVGYPTQAKIRSVIASARSAGIDVAGVRVWPDGSVAAFDRRLGEGGVDEDPGEIEFD